MTLRLMAPKTSFIAFGLVPASARLSLRQLRPARNTSSTDLPDPNRWSASHADSCCSARRSANLLHCRSPFYLCASSTSITWERTASRPETGLLIPSDFDSYLPTDNFGVTVNRPGPSTIGTFHRRSLRGPSDTTDTTSPTFALSGHQSWGGKTRAVESTRLATDEFNAGGP